jgi:uncharacterized UPF0160 family protein
MSHPNPLHDEENTMSQDSFDRFDEMAERTIWPWIDDEGQEWDVEDVNYDDHDDFYDESMDGDHDSAMESAGWGTDEDYGYYGEDY